MNHISPDIQVRTDDESSHDISGLIDTVSGTVKASIYSDPRIYDLEMEKIFGRTWQFLGHVDQIPNFGDYIVVSMGEDSVIVSRQKDKSIGAFLNQCRHRGNVLARGDCGNAKTFTCSYHGWCHDNAGRLISTPHAQDGYHNALKKEEWGAVRVPRVEIYKGMIFGNWDADAITLLEALGDAAWYLDAIIDRNGGVELRGPLKWRVAGNWKWQADQHATDFFHAPISHNSALTVLTPEDAPPASYEHVFFPGERGYQYADPSRGHGTAGFFTNLEPHEGADTLKFPPSPAYEYFAEGVKDVARRHLGEARTDKMTSLVMTIFPNFSINMAASYIRIWQPRGPNETEVLSYCFVDKNATEEEKEAFVRGYAYSFAASGLLEQDDTENVAQCHKGVSGFMARKSRLNMQMGLGHECTDENYRGTLNNLYSEHGARAFYGRWRDLLSA